MKPFQLLGERQQLRRVGCADFVSGGPPQGTRTPQMDDLPVARGRTFQVIQRFVHIVIPGECCAKFLEQYACSRQLRSEFPKRLGGVP